MIISIHAPLAGCDCDNLSGLRFVIISIHAPLAGCDDSAADICRLLDISIHAPLAGCDKIDGEILGLSDISIHAPLAGCDTLAILKGNGQHISIHAPLAGCDHGTWRPTPFPANFNPRTPCGVRLHRPCRSSVKSRFQSTHPLRGATCPKQKPVTGQNISIHAPLAGCDRTQPDRR